MRQSFPSASLPSSLPSLVRIPRSRGPSRILRARVPRTRGKKGEGGGEGRRRRQPPSGSGWKRERKQEEEEDEGPRRAFISNCNARSRNAWDPRRCLDTTLPVRVFPVTRFPDQPPWLLWRRAGVSRTSTNPNSFPRRDARSSPRKGIPRRKVQTG